MIRDDNCIQLNSYRLINSESTSPKYVRVQVFLVGGVVLVIQKVIEVKDTSRLKMQKVVEQLKTQRFNYESDG